MGTQLCAHKYHTRQANNKQDKKQNKKQEARNKSQVGGHPPGYKYLSSWPQRALLSSWPQRAAALLAPTHSLSWDQRTPESS